MLERSDQTILMVDSSKFDTRAFSHIASLQDIDCLITDSKANRVFMEAVEEKNVNVMMVELL
jgi:DeoR/GlpR family transcriptional regulator of sugar metabolism